MHFWFAWSTASFAELRMPRPSADKLPESGVQLLSFEARDGLRAELSTPKGTVRLEAIEGTLSDAPTQSGDLDDAPAP